MSNYPPIQTSTSAYTSTPDLTTEPPANYGELVDYWNKGHASGFFPTSTPEMIEELQAQNERLQGERSGFENTIAQLTIRITDLERSKETREGVLSKSLENNRLYEAQIDYFIETLGKHVRGSDMDYEVAADLAECFGRELTRKVVGHIRIEGDVELEVPAYFDLDDIGDELDIHIGQAYTSVVRIDYSDISLVEIEEF